MFDCGLFLPSYSSSIFFFSFCLKDLICIRSCEILNPYISIEVPLVILTQNSQACLFLLSSHCCYPLADCSSLRTPFIMTSLHNTLPSTGFIFLRSWARWVQVTPLPPLSSLCPAHSALLDPRVPSVLVLSHLSRASLNKLLRWGCWWECDDNWEVEHSGWSRKIKWELIETVIDLRLCCTLCMLSFSHLLLTILGAN